MDVGTGPSGPLADYGRLYALLIDNLEEYAVFMTDCDGVIETWNPGVQRLLGYSLEEWVGQNIAIIFTPEARDESRPADERARAARHGHSRDARWYVRRDGSRFWVEGIVSAIRDSDSRLVAFSKVMRDSTDRLRSEQRLRESERWWRQIVETAAEAIWILDTDATITFANARLCEMLACNAETIEGRHLLDFVFEEDSGLTMQHFHARLNGRGPTVDCRLRRENGDEVWVCTAATPVKTADGIVTGLLAMMIDVTEERRNEEQLRASEERLRLLVASARDYAVIEMDPDRRIVGWDAGAEQVFGWTADEIVGNSADVLFTQEDRERKVPQEESTIALETGSAANDRWHLKKDGARFWATGALMPVLDSNGGHRGFVKIMRDFTERKLREDESRRATESERNRLEFTIATTRSELQRLSDALITAQEDERRRIGRELHDELGQDLAMAEMELSHILSSHGNSSDQQSSLVRLREQVGSISDRLRNLSHGMHSCVLEQLGLTVALRSMCDHLRRSGYPVSLAVRRVPRTLPQSVSTNLLRIAQEACRNTTRHAGRAGIRVFLYATETELRLTVRDSGQGFDPEQARRGTGLGLITMNERARMIGGRLQILSRPAHGTRIRVSVALDDIEIPG